MEVRGGEENAEALTDLEVEHNAELRGKDITPLILKHKEVDE